MLRQIIDIRMKWLTKVYISTTVEFFLAHKSHSCCKSLKGMLINGWFFKIF